MRQKFSMGLSAVVLAGSTIGAHAAELSVVVTSKPIHALVAQVMDGIGTPKLIVSGNASPHSYSMKPSDAQLAQSAGVLFRVSEDLEPFTVKLVKSVPKTVRVVSLAVTPGLTFHPIRRGGGFESADHAHSNDGHGHGTSSKSARSIDPHIWLDPANAKTMIGEIARVLAERSPTDKAKLEANAVRASQKLDALDAEISTALKPAAGRPFIVAHDALQYFEKRYNLESVGSIALTPEEAPSAKRLRELRGKVTTRGAVCVLSEPGRSEKLVATLVEGTTAKTVVVDPEATAITVGPDAYATLMRSLATQLAACLK